jgi:hypothetical protein
MKITLFNVLIIILFILVIVSASMLSCSNFQPHHADNVFKKHSDVEGFANNRDMLDYSSKGDNKMVDTNKQYLMNQPNAECKKVFGFDGLYCTPENSGNKLDKIGSSQGSAKCVGKSSGLSNSLGGLCLDDNQKKLLSTRGGNMTAESDDIGK